MAADSSSQTTTAKMMPSIVGTPDLYNYLLSSSVQLSPAQEALMETVRSHPRAIMSACIDEAQFLAWLLKLMGAKKAIEVGVFLGTTTLAMAQALPADGKVVALDINEEFTSVAAKFWAQAGVDKKIDLRIAPATQSLESMISLAGEAGTYDLAFIDADKPNYDNYYELCLQLVRVGGVIAIDNVFWGGGVIDLKYQDEDTVSIRTLNSKVSKDKRVAITMLPLADGVTLCRKL